MSIKSALVVFAVLIVACVSRIETPTPPPPPTLPVATGIPVTPRAEATQRANAAPTATVEPLPTPAEVTTMFEAAGTLLSQYKPPETDPRPLYDALAGGAIQFLTATANGDVSLEGQPALEQLKDALQAIPNLPEQAQPQVVAIHTGDDQGGSRDLVFVGIQGVMGLPILALERLGASYEILPPLGSDSTSADARNFYPGQLEAREMTGDELQELIYVLEFPGASGTTNELTVARWIPEPKALRTIFRAALINWAGESDFAIEAAADATTIRLTFPWFGAFDHKLLAHPNASQTWEYDEQLDRFVRVSQTIDPPRTPRQQLNAAEYAFRNGDLNGALERFQRVWQDESLEAEDFGESKADPKAFARFRAAVVAGLLGDTGDARTWLGDVQRSAPALGQLAQTYARNSSGRDGALRGWIAIANAGDLYQLIYESKAGNLDFPFEADEIYWQGGIVASYLNTHTDADKDPAAVWSALDALGFQTLSRASADLDGDGTPEFLFVTQEGGTSPNKAQSLWFVYKHVQAWRARTIEYTDSVRVSGEPVALPNSHAKALRITEASATPSELALTWDGSRILWLDGQTLQPRSENEGWTAVGGGVLQDDF